MPGQIAALMENVYYRHSVIFYLMLISIATILAFGSQKNNWCGKCAGSVVSRRKEQAIYNIQKLCFLCSFLVLWFFSAFANCGADRKTYGWIFEEVNIEQLFDGWQEPGFILFNLLFRVLGDNPRIIYVAISTVTLVLVYMTLYRVKEEISIGFAVLGYVTLYYVQSLSLMRIYMAAAILFWGVPYLLKQNYIKYGIVILGATMIHYSALAMFLPWIFLCFLKHRRYKMNLHIAAVFACFGIVFAGLVMFAPILGNITIFSRFQRYLEGISFNGIGVMQFIYYIPICILVALVYNKCSENYRKIFIAFTYSAFFIGVLSYLIPMLGRMSALFHIIYLFIIPYILKILKENLQCRGRKGAIVYYIICLSVVGYYYLRFLIYIGEYAFLDSVVPYVNSII